MVREKNKPTSSEGNRGKIFIPVWKGQEGSPQKIFKCRRHLQLNPSSKVGAPQQGVSSGGCSKLHEHSPPVLQLSWCPWGIVAPLHCHFPFLCDAQGLGQGHCLCSVLQLRGISAFQGRKSAFLVFHFTACFCVWEFQKCTAEPMCSPRQHVGVAQPLDVPLPSGSHGPRGAFHQLCIHFTITQ